MGTRTSVVNITYNMEMIDDKSLDQIAQGNDKVRRPSDSDDGMNDLIVVTFFIGNLRFFCDELFYNIGKIFGSALRTFDLVYLEATVLVT